MNQLHGIDLKIHQFPLHGPLKQDMHQAANMPLALWRQIELADPLFDEDWFHLCDGIIAPLRLNVMGHPRTVLASRYIPLWNLFPHVPVDESPERYLGTWIVPVDGET